MGVGSHKGTLVLLCQHTYEYDTSIYISVYAMVERHFEEIYAAVYSFPYARDTLLGGSSGHVDVREG